MGATIIPFVPGGASAVIKAVRVGDKVHDTVNAAEIAADGLSTADKLNDAENIVDEGNLLYRSMKKSDDGLPEVGSSARTLGARPQVDIAVNNGMVKPGTKGMSVTPKNPSNLPSHRKPRELGGTGKDPAFCINQKCLPDGLQYRPDPDNPINHGFIEPSREMSFEEYQRLIEQTREFWRN